MSTQEDFLRKQSVGSIFAVVYQQSFPGSEKYYDKKLEFLRVDKITETKLICRKMTKAKDKWVPQGGSLDRVSLVLTLDDFAKTCYTNYRSFYNPEDPALIKIKAEIEASTDKISAFYFIKDLKIDQLTPEILPLVRQIQEKIEWKKTKEGALVKPSQNHERNER